MPEHSHGRPRRVARGTISVALVLALSGALFAANARLTRDSEERRPHDLVDLARLEESRNQRLTDEAVILRAEVAELLDAQTSTSGLQLPAASVAEQVAAAKMPVTGTGLTVRLDDAPVRTSASVDADSLVVHQQDIQAVMNALWAGGAEAMTLMGQRVISTSAVRCIGAVVYLHGLRYSPPYTIEVIGDPARLQAALAKDPVIDRYQDYVDTYGLGWSVAVQDSLELPAYEGPADLAHAAVPEGVEVLSRDVVAAPRTRTALPRGSSDEDDR
ncbi:DUF881 domain-containing protein [Cellulomonas timonensis]|uniref:DUF881 domain-containing protein n=1 Tax=Cellulomonas timonensis TaxID=1689271 RepID=UPI0009ED4979|nr:DUF881 domain-containing protein [Cellulomonas timonensis]